MNEEKIAKGTKFVIKELDCIHVYADHIRSGVYRIAVVLLLMRFKSIPMYILESALVLFAFAEFASAHAIVKELIYLAETKGFKGRLGVIFLFAHRNLSYIISEEEIQNAKRNYDAAVGGTSDTTSTGGQDWTEQIVVEQDRERSVSADARNERQDLLGAQGNLE